VSLHYYNTDEELDRLCSVLESLVVGRQAHAV
jgi:selenocysteine lyase/cysteine desulfurase